MTPPVSALRAENLYRFYRVGDEETLALQGVSLSVEPGEMVAVIGPSGSGKSTLLACLAGLDEPSGGAVSIEGVRLSHRPDGERAALRAHRIGVLLQTGNLLPHLTVLANLQLVQSAGRRPGQVSPESLLRDVRLESRAHALPRQLSGGELARAGLAVAMANSPAVLLADEPTGELDGSLEDEVLDLLRKRAVAGTAVLLVTHSTGATEAADRVIALEDGRIRS